MQSTRQMQSANEIIGSLSTAPKMKSSGEITARYNLKRQEYQELKAISDNSPEKREQLAMLYAEAKVLGWILGKTEKQVITEVHGQGNLRKG